MAAWKGSTGRDEFHVRQRVRYRDYPQQHATVVSQRVWKQCFANGRCTDEYHYVYLLDVDGYGTHAPEGFHYGRQQHELEPIYDGDQLSSWAEMKKLCGWTPTPEHNAT